MSDQNQQTIDWVAIAEYAEHELGTDRTTAGEYVLEWVFVRTQNDPNFDRNAIPYSELDRMMEIFADLHRMRQSEESAAVRDLIQGLEEAQRRKNEAEQHGDKRQFDPDFILEEAEVEIVVGNTDTTFITNESATEFIEKYLLLAWTALKNSDHLNDEAAPGLLHNQDPGDTTMDIIAECVGQVGSLNGLTEDGILTIA